MKKEVNKVDTLSNIKFSILDLAQITVGGSPAESFQHSADLAQHAEKWGYHRYWLAEHHNMPGIASSATSVVIGYVANATKTIRVGSGGIMLPNHSPLVIAEQFGTLEAMYPGRIDLGLGRAPGSDQQTAVALRRDPRNQGQDFPEQLAELRMYLEPASRNNRIRAIPGEGQDIPIWLLGSSGFSAVLAAELGLPFSFASHFSPENMQLALARYRQYFKPSEVLDEPHVMVAVNVYAADTMEEAQRIATSHQQQFLNLIRNTPGQLPPPVDSMENLWSEYEKSLVMKQLQNTIIGTHEEVKKRLEDLAQNTKADEIIIATTTYDHQARLRSFEIVAEVVGMK
ncbi:LLM class flavin-dependent oxidoreductase [Peribacillus asahii]|uniref:LLM class flavin-dependent oxidoreductase n=1 Tax=Peribacillus asahii TaxID=228899 RepID=A0A398B6B7_9BACI|nr:LLM class flavin-dependent oxidoreductase [Peribacillus asahii]RID84358.1 LLM class flavin-dependent oxidoreductase [Peribacillus asahii]